MIEVAERAVDELGKERVVLAIRRRHDDDARMCDAEDRALEVRASSGIDMLDDLEHRDRIEAAQSSIGVDQRGGDERDSLAQRVGHEDAIESLLGTLELAHRDVDADDAIARRFGCERHDQISVAATEVDHGSHTLFSHHRDDGAHPRVLQAHRPFERALRIDGLDGVFRNLPVTAVEGVQTRDRHARQRRRAPKIPFRDELALRMNREPLGAVTKQPLDLLVADPVLSLVVERGDQDREMREQTSDRRRRAQRDRADGDPPTPPPGRRRDRRRPAYPSGPNSRRGQPTLRGTRTGGHDGLRGRYGAIDELRTVGAALPEPRSRRERSRRSERMSERHRDDR